MRNDPFVVHVARLRRSPGSCRREQRSGPVDPYAGVGPPGPGDSIVAEGREVACDVLLQAIPGGVMVSGTVSIPWAGVCRRCTADVGGELEVAVRERFLDDPGSPEISEDEAYLLRDDLLDLGALVHDAVVLELPTAPLCGDDCLGLCPACGANRNEADCRCVAAKDPRWASLDVLRSGL